MHISYDCNTKFKKTTLNYIAKKNTILEKCFNSFVKKGIESTTTRDFCDEAGINANTLYYYFSSKSEILIECVDYGYRQLESALYSTLIEFDKTTFDFFPKMTKIGLDYAPQMRFLHQAVSSPAYEAYRENQFKKINEFYDRFGEELAGRFECPFELIEDYIHAVMTLLSYFSLWGSRDMAAIQFNKIFSNFRDAVNNYKKINDLAN